MLPVKDGTIGGITTAAVFTILNVATSAGAPVRGTADNGVVRVKPGETVDATR